MTKLALEGGVRMYHAENRAKGNIKGKSRRSVVHPGIVTSKTKMV